jgi:hypothetical protein
MSPVAPSTNTGALATAAWLAGLELFPSDPHWSVDITLCAPTARFTVEVYAEEWGYRFACGERLSWIRVTDLPFVHGRDELELLRRTTRLPAIGSLIRDLEHEHGIAFDCLAPEIRSSFGGVEVIRSWVRATTSAGTPRG